MPDENDSGRLRVGVTGCGIISRTHIRAAAKVPEVEIVAASSRDSTALNAISDEYGIPHRFDQWQALVESDVVDAVLICLPDGLHEEATCEAARCGKHVLVEKPMANSLAQCQAMVTASNAASIVLMVAQVTRQLPSHHLAKRLLQEGEIGVVKTAARRRHWERGKVKPALAKRSWMSDRKMCTDPLLFGLGSHEFDAMLWLLESEANSVHADGVWTEDWSGWERIESSISLRSGIDVNVSLAVETDQDEWDTVIRGSDGTIALYADRVVLGGVETPCPWSHDEAFGAQLEEFANCVRDEREPGPSGRNVLPTMALLDGVLSSMKQQADVELPQFGVEW